jgi:hypothetical protein
MPQKWTPLLQSNEISDKGSLDRIALDRITWSKFSNKTGVWSKLCLITWSKVLINDINIWSLDRIFWDFSVDRNFKITQNTIIRTFDQVPKKNLRILALDRKFKKPKIPLLELSIKCQNP